MWILIFTVSYLLSQKCSGLDLIDVPDEPFEEDIPAEYFRRVMDPAPLNPYPPTKKPAAASLSKPWLFRQSDFKDDAEDEKDVNIKNKIATLVQQTMHDTEGKMKSIQTLKNKHRDKPPYKIGFILSMIKKARDVLNELFNVAVKHRDQWKALEQLKIFELIVHTNVDTTNLVRQLVEIHIQHLNSTSGTRSGKRVVLL